MKHYLIIPVFIFFTFTSYSQEVKDTASKWHSNNILKVNAIGLFMNYNEFTYERVLTEKNTAVISYGTGYRKTISGEDAQNNYLSRYHSLSYPTVEQKVYINYQYRFTFRSYLRSKNKIPAGFHIGPSLSFSGYGEKFNLYDHNGMMRDEVKNDYTVVGLNFELGPQILIKRIVAIDLFVAPGFGFLKAKESSNNSSAEDEYTGSGFVIQYGILCGIAFGK